MLLLGGACNDDNGEGGGKNPPSIEVGEVSFSEQDGTAKVEVRPSENTETWYWKCVPAGEEADYESVTGNEATTLDLTVTVDVDYVVSAYAENADGKSDVVTKDFKISSAELKGELVEGADDVLQRLEVVEMVGVDVQDNGDIRVELQKGVDKLTGLADHDGPLPPAHRPPPEHGHDRRPRQPLRQPGPG